MSGNIKGLAGETIIYGASTMLGRFLNWLLMPFYIRLLLPEEYGVVINIYGIISVLLVVFTYGLETGFFRFSAKESRNDVYKSSLWMIGSTSLVLILVTELASGVISDYFYNGLYRNSIILVSVIVAFDSFLAIPFAKLRLNNQALKFGCVKIVNILLNIGFNLLFLLLIPWLIKKSILGDSLINLYQKGNGVFYVILSNALSSVLILVFFIKDLIQLQGKFNRRLLANIMNYSWPVLVVGITGMLIQNSDKVLMPKLIKENGFKELAVYGANFKIGVLMSLFTQSFRFAFEPYFFKNQDRGNSSYAKIMEYFIFFGVTIFLGVMLFLDLINILLTPEYLYGNIIIPFVLVAQLFYGIYFNLSLWYKLTDKTIFGAFFGIGGTLITLFLLFILIPQYGIIGGGISIMTGYGLMMVVSYFVGKKFYPVSYSLKRIGTIVLGGLVVYLFDFWIQLDASFYRFIFKGVIFVSYIVFFLLVNGNLVIKKNSKWLTLKL